MNKSFDMAVVGAVNAVTELIVELLAERDFPLGNLYLLSANNHAGKVVQFKNTHLKVRVLKEFDFSMVQLVIFADTAEIAGEYIPKAVETGCIVIDNSSRFRFEDDVPLVVADVNPQAIAEYRKRSMIAALPTISNSILIALNSLHQAADITHINIATYQAVSGFDNAGVEELAGQTANLLNMRPVEVRVFSKQIAFNQLPQIGEILENAYTREEMNIVSEVRKVFANDAIRVNATAVQVPVFHGDAAVIQVQTQEKLSAQQAQALMEKAPGIRVFGEKNSDQCPTAVTDASGNDEVLVGRIREDLSTEHGLNLWIVADRIRKCAALNSIQIAEILVKDHL